VSSNDYHFVTHWTLPDTTCQEVSDILARAEDLVRWWPSVYLDVKVTEPGDAHDIGKRVELFTKGWLPYTLRWAFRVVENREPHGFTIEALGDFRGRGIWTFVEHGTSVRVTYDWKIRAEKGLLKYLSFVFKPIFARNHYWAMAKGEESLRLELRRRHAHTDAERDSVPAPPPPTFVSRGRRAKTR
jgi:hypothetical protein